MIPQLTNNSADILFNEDHTQIVIEGASTVSRECDFEKPRLDFIGDLIGGETVEVYIYPKNDPVYAYRPSVTSGTLDDSVYPWLWTLIDVAGPTQATFTVTMFYRSPTNTQCTITTDVIGSVSNNPIDVTCSINTNVNGGLSYINIASVNCSSDVNVEGTVNRNPAEVDCVVTSTATGTLYRGGNTDVICDITTDVLGGRIFLSGAAVDCLTTIDVEGTRFCNPAEVDCSITIDVDGKINLSNVADVSCTVNINAVAEVV